MGGEENAKAQLKENMAREMANLLRALAERTGSVVLEPESCFVAWQGVIVLAWSGFPPPIARLKEDLAGIDNVRLKPEGPGSKWPKTTLGALKDGAPPLTLSQLRALKGICERHSSRLRALGARVPVNSLAAVEYEWRGLERLRARYDFSLSGVPSVDPVVAANADTVRAVLSEWDDEEIYLEHLNRPGSRISSYREASPAGSTLVAFLGEHLVPGGAASALAGLLSDFRDDVDAELSGNYEWLAALSLHCTVRSLDPLPAN